MKAKNIIAPVILCAALFAVGCGAGTFISKSMKKAKAESAGYIGRSEIQIQDGKMTPEVLLSFGRLSDPQISPDGKKVIYGVSYTSIEDNRSCRNLYISNIDGSERHELTHYAKSVSNARWSADGSHIYFLQGGQLWSAPISGNKLGKKVQLSDVPAGISEFKISPDEAMIIYTSTIHGAVQTPADSDPALDKAEAYATEDLMYRHWDHWVTETPRTFVSTLQNTITPDNSFDILGSEPYELPAEPFSGIEQLCWSPDSRFVAYSCRKAVGQEYAFSTDTEIYVYCILTGETKVIPMGGGYDTDPVWSPDGRHIAWISMARNGYESDQTRLFTADFFIDEAEEGQGSFHFGEARQVCDFGYDVTGPVWKDDSESIYFSALVDGLQGIFVAGLDGSVKRITDEDWYDFSSPWAEVDGKLLTSYCSLDFPTELVSVDIASGEFKQITNENENILSQLDPVKCEKRMIKTVDGKDMLTWVLYPPKFDESKQYPCIEICLGGPQGTLSQGWSYRWNYRLMAQQGYIVAMPNRRGTTAFGQEWKEEISGDYCGLNIQDYLSAAREMKAEPYVNNIAACGASYGGYSVYYLAGVHGDTFDCFVAHAGIFDEEYLYYTTEEMWFADWDNGGLGRGRLSGSPWSDIKETKRHYANAPVTNVQNWHTPILCLHGGMDFRIPYDQGMAAFNCAQYMGVPSKLVVFPTECHWILQPQNALYWHRTYFDWLDKWMK